MAADKLSKLIDSLDPQEKRYFRLHSSLYNLKSNHLKLYDVLIKDPSAGNEKLARVLNNGTNVSGEKERLYQAIMAALRNYQQQDSIPGSLIKGISNIQILMQKGMYWDCMVLADKLYDEAMSTNNFGYALVILGQKQNCNIRLQDIKGLQAYTIEQKKLLKLIAETEGLKSLQSSFTSWAHQTSTALNVSSRKFISAILSSPFLSKPAALSSFYNKIMAYRLVSSCNHRCGDNQKAFAAISAALNLFKKQPEMIQLYMQPYIALLFTAEGIVIELGNLTLSHQYLYQLEQLLKTKHPLLTDGFKSDWMAEIVIRKIILYDAEDNYDTVLERCKNNSTSPRLKMPANQIMIHFYCAKAYFCQKKYDDALDMISKNMNMLNAGVRLDLLLASQLMHIMVQVMLGNASITPSFIASYARNCRKNKTLDTGIKSLVHFLNKLAKAYPNRPQRKKLCNNFIAEFNASGERSTNIRYVFDVTNFMRWVESIAA